MRMAPRGALPLLALAAVALLAGLWAGLLRLGWAWPPLQPGWPAVHGPLMFSAFLGTLISLERAVALKWRAAYAVPMLSGLGGLALLIGLPAVIGQASIALGSLGLVLLHIGMYRMHRAPYVTTMGLGALAWLVGNALWLAGWPIPTLVLWWVAFLVLTIAGERLELARLLAPTRTARVAFAAAVAALWAGLILSLGSFAWGVAIGGAGLAALGAWLMRQDVARRTIRQTGLTRYIAACLLPGYAWLIFGGALWFAFGVGAAPGLAYDAALHAVTLGFVFSMIFGHAPIIIPSLMNVAVVYRPAWYVPLALLQVSLAARILGDLTINLALRQWGGLFNAVAILLFLGMILASVRRS